MLLGRNSTLQLNFIFVKQYRIQKTCPRLYIGNRCDVLKIIKMSTFSAGHRRFLHDYIIDSILLLILE